MPSLQPTIAVYSPVTFYEGCALACTLLLAKTGEGKVTAYAPSTLLDGDPNGSWTSRLDVAGVAHHDFLLYEPYPVSAYLGAHWVPLLRHAQMVACPYRRDQLTAYPPAVADFFEYAVRPRAGILVTFDYEKYPSFHDDFELQLARQAALTSRHLVHVRFRCLIEKRGDVMSHREFVTVAREVLGNPDVSSEPTAIAAGRMFRDAGILPE